MWRSIKAVLWAFLGIRKQADYDQDVKSITPVQAIVTGVVLAAVFVIGLIVLVRFLVAK
jgi:hypothetical protein